MMAKEEKAAAKTTKRECFMAIIAAIKNVLSPISETIIMSKEITNDFSNSLSDENSKSVENPVTASLVVGGAIGRLASISFF